MILDLDVALDQYLDFTFDDFDLPTLETFEKPLLEEVNYHTQVQSVLAPRKTSVRKVNRACIKKITPLKRGMSVSEALFAGASPNLSRRSPTSTLVAFPHFDKCDSLLYFPNSLTRHLNSSDMNNFSKLLLRHLDKECTIEFNFTNERKVSLPDFLKFWNVANELEPDRIACAHSTKVIDNRIKSTISMKLTDCQPLYKAISRTAMVQGNFLGFDAIVDRSNRFKVYAQESTLPEAVAQQLLSYAESEHDLVLYL